MCIFTGLFLFTIFYSILIMYNYNTVTFQDQLKFLIDNLEQGAGLFTTDEGRKACYNSLLVEIKRVNLIMRRNIQLIQDNKVLFPSQSLFKTDFLTPKDLLKTCQGLLRDNPLVPPRLIKAIDELRDLLQEAHSCLDSPTLQKMIVFYDVLWDKFCTKKWPDMQRQFQSHTIACLPLSPYSRQRAITQHLNKTLDALKAHPIASHVEGDGELLDEISLNGQLVPSVIAPILYNYRSELKNNNRIYEFFRLFMNYQLLLAERDKIGDRHANDNQHALETWFLGLGHKLEDNVAPTYTEQFDELLINLCRQPDLAQALMKGTLNEPFNIKLAYNLFGIMNDNGVFITRTVSTLRKCLAEKRVDEYFKAYLYKNYDSYASELSDTLFEATLNTIKAWQQ